jgi:hypothetical protein
MGDARQGIDFGQDQVVPDGPFGRKIKQVRPFGLAGGPVGGTDVPAEGDRRHHIGRGGAEELVHGPQRDAADQPLVALGDLVFRARHRLDRVARLHVTVRAYRRHDPPRGQFVLDREVPVVAIVGDLVTAGEPVRVPGSIEHAAGEPFHGLGITRGERRLAAGDGGVVRRRPRAFLGDLLVILGPGGGQRSLPPGFLPPVFGLCGLEAGPCRRRLPPVAGGSAEQTAQPARPRGREIAPVRTGGTEGPGGFSAVAWVEPRHPRRDHEPVEAHRLERQHAGQHLVQALDLLRRRGGLLARGPLLSLETLLLADLFLFHFLPLAFPVKTLIFPVLRGQAVLPLGGIPAVEHDGLLCSDHRASLLHFPTGLPWCMAQDRADRNGWMRY